MNEATDKQAVMRQGLGGRTCWIITDGKAGMVVQARGVADALGLDYELKTVQPKGIRRLLAPWGPIGADEKFGQAGSDFTPPWPDVAIATGRASIPYIRALRRRAGKSCFTVVLQDPKTGADTADLIWVPQHDKLRGTNVMTTLTSPHSFSGSRLEALRGSVPVDVAEIPKPRVAVILGGKNTAYKFRESDDSRLEQSLASIGRLGASFMITTSRRTHQRLLQAVERATAFSPRILWAGAGENPYPNYLAHADWLVVTADSVNMTGEACATGRPVYVFTPSGGTAKFARFHAALRNHGATRALPDEVTALETWSYEPLDSARLIAEKIELNWRQRFEDPVAAPDD